LSCNGRIHASDICYGLLLFFERENHPSFPKTFRFFLLSPFLYAMISRGRRRFETGVLPFFSQSSSTRNLRSPSASLSSGLWNPTTLQSVQPSTFPPGPIFGIFFIFSIFFPSQDLLPGPDFFSLPRLHGFIDPLLGTVLVGIFFFFAFPEKIPHLVIPALLVLFLRQVRRYPSRLSSATRRPGYKELFPWIEVA